MNSKKTPLLGLSIGVVFALVIFSTSLPLVEAEKPIASGKPDFVATIDMPADEDHYNGEKGRAMFWVDADSIDDPNMRIAYKIILQNIDVGEIGNDGTGQDGNSGKGLETYLWKLHLHPAPGQVHDGNYHHFNILGPADDSELKISGNTLTGIWDKDDWSDLGNDNHESVDPVTVIGEMCNSETDLNIHSEVHHIQIRGIITPNSDFCNS